MAALRDLCDDLGSALLLITHDLAMACRWCDRMAVVDGGQVAEVNRSDVVLTYPSSRVGQRLLAAARAREGGHNPRSPSGSHGAGRAGAALLAQPRGAALGA